MKDIELPPPLGYMNAGHVHELQQGRLHYGYVYPKGGTGAEEAVFTADQLRAAVEADRAQRVPEGKVLVDRGALNMVINALRRDASDGRAVRGEMADALLAATPAPAQQEPEKELEPRMSRACLDAWDKSRFTSGSQDAVHPMFFEAFSAGFKAAQHQEPAQQAPSPIKAEHKTVTPSGTVVTRLELTDKAKESLRADVTHIPGIAKHQEPPRQERQIAEALRRRGLTLVKTANGYDVMELGQITAQASGPQQERKPMTEQERHALLAGLLSEPADTPTEMFRLIVERVERHHGIKE